MTLCGAPHFFLARLQGTAGYSFPFVFQLHTPYSFPLCPADCFQDILLEQAGNSHWNKLAFLHISSDISAPWAHESNSLDVNAAKHARNCSEIESGCFEIFQSQFGNPPISPLKFLSCSACWSKKQDAGMLTSNANSSSPTMSHALEKTKAARIGVICLSASSKLSASCLHDSIDVYTATRAKSSRKVQEDKWRSLCVVCLLAMFRHRKWLFWDLQISVRKFTNIALQVLVMQSLLVDETRCWNGD